jgi:hypothetical protein
MTDYLHLRRLHTILWKPKTPPTTFVWIDPDDYNQPVAELEKL